MFKYLTPATAIALALGLQACGTTPFPQLDVSGAFSGGDSQYAKDSGYINGQMALAEASMSAGSPATAIRIYRSLTQKFPLAVQPRIRLGEALLASNAAQEAARAFEGANGIRETHDGLVGLGRVELALRQPAAALGYFDKAAKLKPDDSIVQNGRAVALDQLGRHAEAQQTYLTLLQKEPNNLKVRNNYALSLALDEKYDDATDILQSLVQVPDSEERIRQNLALVYGLQGNDGQAAHISRMDLDENAVKNNLKYYQSIRNLDSPSARAAALTQPSRTGFTSETNADSADASPSWPQSASNEPLGSQTAEATNVTNSIQRVRPAKKNGDLASLPMTRAEAATPSGKTAATAAKPASNSFKAEAKPAKSASKAADTERTSAASKNTETAKAEAPGKTSVKEAPGKLVAKPADQKTASVSAAPATAKAKAKKQKTAKVKLPAVPALAPARSGALSPAGETQAVRAGDSKPVREAKAQAEGKTDVPKATPIDTGVRKPAVPALL